MGRLVSFPRLGNYHVPFGYFVGRVLEADILVPPPITKRTLELGGMYSPDFVCAPFKFNLGNYLEALEAGATTLMQFGGPCRLGYYGELHEVILRDMGHEFEFLNLAEIDRKNPKSVWTGLKKWNQNLSIENLVTTLTTTYAMVEQMDKLENYIRSNKGFETHPGTFDEVYGEYLKAAVKATGKKELKRIYAKYLKEISGVEISKPKDLLKVGIIGEYYTIMEPFSNHFLEKELSGMKVYVTRTMNVSSTFFHRKVPRIISKIKNYIRYDIGATGVDTVNSALTFAKSGYDGLIHVKSFGCMPEIDAISILQNVSRDYKIPILYFSFDTETGDVGVKTRLEAFYDMIIMRKGLGHGSVYGN